jgi:replication-associated recombination protein RarA
MKKWYEMKTSHGYNADEVISSLQKEIRRGEEENTAIWTYELIISGPDFAEKFWERVLTISVEDVGFANPNAIVIVNNLKQAYYSKIEKSGDGMLHAIFAAVFLARSKKDRFVDELLFYIQDQVENNNLRLDIKDYALDKHTKKGKELQRDFLHFITEAAHLNNEDKTRNRKYYDYMLNKFRNDKHN